MHRVHKEGDGRCRQETYDCPECDSSFTNETDLSEHIDIHSDAMRQEEILDDTELEDSICLEDFGIVQQPVVMHRIKQDFKNLHLNENGDIEDDDDSESETYSPDTDDEKETEPLEKERIKC